MNIITHRIDEYNEVEELEKIRKRIESESNASEKLVIFNQLCEFEYGRWLLINRGLNAYWASYIVFYDEMKDKSKQHPLEKAMLEKSPGVLCSRERGVLNKGILEKMIKENMTVASIPCAAMNDLLRLNIGNIKNIKFVGVDLDPYAINMAKENSKIFKKEKLCSFKLCDAWNLNYVNEFDILHSSGLNMYVQKEKDLLNLYSNFFKAIKHGGHLLVTSNMPPMDENGMFFWNVSKAEMDELPSQGMILTEIVKIRQGIFCTKNEIIKQLQTVGFSEIDVDYDSRKMFLCFIAKKP